MRKLLIALSFFTRIPITLKDVTNEEFYSSMKLLPLVGVVIGGVLYFFWYITSALNIEIRALLLLVIYIWITGAIHIDGFVDSIDGLMSNREKHQVLEIMKDSRLGAFGAVGLILLFLSYFILFKFSLSYTIFIMPVVGRCLGLFASSLCDYAKDTNDLGKGYIDSIGIKERYFSLILLIIAGLVFKYYYLLSILIVLLITFIIVRMLRNKIGGMTGDTTGMIIEISQVIFLISSYIVNTII